ncbi:uncharacterized protein LOC131938519 isoform X2 [Physella acuta]|nr:uncharacterized protein LOC131938519 isoform X2 [Physella acuta]
MMASLIVKKRMMYTVFVFIFICGGIEYAVILPTLWLYLRNNYNSPEYMLGLVLSAYSVAAFLSSPVLGRLTDRFHCTKKIFLICSTFELAGSFLYFIGISQWLCVSSRFISGLGAASEAIAIAEVSRYTSEKERTGIISNLVASRQIALLIGPGLNLFLRKADFKLGPFDVTKYSAPGAFMVLMWVCVMVIILTMYTEPRVLYALEATSAVIEAPQAGEITQSNEQLAGSNADNRRGYHDDVASTQGKLNINERLQKLTNEIPSDRVENDREFLDSGEVFVYPPLTQADTGLERQQDDEFKDVWEPKEKLKENLGDELSASSVEFHDTRPPTRSSNNSDGRTDSFLQLSCSIDLMVSAERFINNTEWEKTRAQNGGSVNPDFVFHEEHFGQSFDNASLEEDERMPLMSDRRAARIRGRSAAMNTHVINDPYIERSTSVLDDPIAREGKMGFFCNEYIRDEIMAIVFLLFCAMFSQVCVETMVLPLTLKYLDFGELENSLLYAACGVEILIVFFIMSRLSRCVSDRVLMLFGAVMILASNIWLLWYLPSAPPHNRMKNIPYFAVAVFFDILSLPFLLVCATSLYSKLTRKQTQGLSQGLRRGVVGLGTIIAPLWGSSASNQPFVLLGVLVGLQSLSLVLCVLSYKRLKVIRPTTTVISSPPPKQTASHSQTPVSTQNTNNNLAIPIRSNQSTPYGSIQRSYAGSSYHSVGSLYDHHA